MSRLFVIGKRYYTNKDALREQFGRIYQLPLHWHRLGHEAELLLLDYHGNTSEEAVEAGFGARSIPALRPGTLRRIQGIVEKARPDVIVASGDCFVGLAGWWLSRRVGAKFVFDVYDDYRTFGAYRLFLGWDAFGFLLRRASAVWYASRSLARQHVAPSSWRLVPNGVDIDRFQPMNPIECRQRLGLGLDTRWVGYFGSMEAERGLQDLISAVGILHAWDSRVRLVLCGGHPSRQRIEEPWIEDRGNVSHADVPAFINACDVVVLPYRRGPTIDHASSLKMAEYLFCRRPLVATLTPSLSENFPLQAAELGAAIARPSDPEDLARAIRLQLDQPTVASVPMDQTWAKIAEAALSQLQGTSSAP